MKATVDVRSFREAFLAVAAVAPARSNAKPVLESVLLYAHPGGSTLTATDLEVAARRGVPAEAREPGVALLPRARFAGILKTTDEPTLDLEADGGTLLVRGGRSEFSIQVEDPALFPAPPEFPEGEPAATLTAADLATAIRRVAYSVDPASTRYALGGALVELGDGRLALVTTDARRLSRQEVPAACAASDARRVVPARALELLAGLLPGDCDAEVVLPDDRTVHVRAGALAYSARLTEGRFPRWRDVFPAEDGPRVPVAAGPLCRALQHAGIMDDPETKAFDLHFGPGLLRLEAVHRLAGSARVGLPVAYDGEPAVVRVNPAFLLEPLRTFDAGAEVLLVLPAGKADPLMLRADDGRFVAAIMPITREP